MRPRTDLAAQASRLERLTRELDVELVVSDDVVTRIQQEGSPVDVRLGRLTRCGDVHLRGRVHPITVWTARSTQEAMPTPEPGQAQRSA